MAKRYPGKIGYRLEDIYHKMFTYFGSRGWWPGDTEFEICVGAILTQSVSWKNVSKAIANLKEKGLLDLNSMYECGAEDIEQCIIPTMYYRMKARKLKAFVNHVREKYDGNLEMMLQKPLAELRAELLNIYGIGPETADSIILYASSQPIFVVDAYTKRIFSRLGIFNEKTTYQEMQDFFMKHIPADTPYYNEYHALIVGIGNRFCGNKKPKCSLCPLQEMCQFPKKYTTKNN